MIRIPNRIILILRMIGSMMFGIRVFSLFLSVSYYSILRLANLFTEIFKIFRMNGVVLSIGDLILRLQMI